MQTACSQTASESIESEKSGPESGSSAHTRARCSAAIAEKNAATSRSRTSTAK